jgi:hypothetical protein
LLKDDKVLNIEKDEKIDKVYFLQGEKKKFVSSIELLQDGIDYYMEDNVEESIDVHDLEEFYTKLKIEEDMDDEDIATIKRAFDAQELKFKQLIATGALAMTDEILKTEFGIKFYGQRTAILSAIRRIT